MENKNVFGEIYKITNIKNGKKYFGQTIKGYLNRWIRGHIGKAYKRKKNDRTEFQSAIVKYGKESFKIELICRCPIELLDKMEIYYIAKYKTNVCRYPESLGYNLTDGGGGCRGYKLSLESRNKISEKNKGKKWTEDRKNEMSKIMTGEGNPFYDCKHTLESRNKISEKNKGKERTEEQKKEMSKTQIKYFEEHPEAREEISNRVSGEGNPFYNHKHTEETKEKMRKNMKGIKRTPEQCLNISLAKRGYVPSEDTKAKLRITTSGENNGNAKNYKIILPDGTTKIIKCLRVFCSENNLNYASANYHSKSGTPYKNYIIEKVIK